MSTESFCLNQCVSVWSQTQASFPLTTSTSPPHQNPLEAKKQGLHLGKIPFFIFSLIIYLQIHIITFIYIAHLHGRKVQNYIFKWIYI